jgi:uracil phosphoribosyltransferase
MRTFSTFISNRSKALKWLDVIADKATSPEDYRTSFQELGKILGSIVVDDKRVKHQQILLCCTNEDADWLANGILETVSKENTVFMSVLWNKRHSPGNDEVYAVAPVVKTYLEPMHSCDLLIVCKSIIYTSCVVRSNIQYLFEKVKPKHIIILSPVMYKGADTKLRAEFPTRISKDFEFVYLAQDDEANDKGEVVPGIGGSIYDRIGLGGKSNKNAYIPEIVKYRRTLAKPLV